MSKPCEGIKDILQNASVGSASSGSWLIRIGKSLDTPDQLITIYDTGGLNPNPKWLLDFPTVQVVVRGPKQGYEAAWDKCVQVKGALLGYESADLNGDRWVSITGMGDIGFIGYDDKDRPLFSLNYRLIIEPATSSPTNREPL